MNANKFSVFLLLGMILIFVLMGIRHLSRIELEDIQIPEYYHPYDYEGFWKERGVSFNFTAEFETAYYKDKSSQNFLSIGTEDNTVITDMNESERIKYFTSEAKKLQSGLSYGSEKTGTETYSFEFSHTLNGKKSNYYTTHVLFLNAQQHIVIDFSTFSNERSGTINDYHKLVQSIVNH